VLKQVHQLDGREELHPIVVELLNGTVLLARALRLSVQPVGWGQLLVVKLAAPLAVGILGLNDIAVEVLINGVAR